MSGHTHAQNIRHKKDAIDKKRGKLFSTLAKAITIAVKHGGGDPITNLALKYAIDKAKAGNMPNDTIDRSIKKGTGELAGGEYVEQTYEGVGPGGIHIMVQCLTDNKNRTPPEIRKLFERSGGKLGARGSTAWMFEKRGIFAIPTEQISEDDLLMLILEAGAEDMSTEGDIHEVTTDVASFEAVKKALEENELKPTVAEIMDVPKSRIRIDDPAKAKKILRFFERLEDHEDVQGLASNEDIPDEVAAQLDMG